MDNKEKIGKHIAQQRKTHNYTQKALAEILNVSFQAVSKWERGYSLPDLEILHTISSLFNQSFNYFLFAAYSSLSLDELIKSVNKSGITKENYASIASLFQSDLIGLEMIEMFSDDLVKKALKIVLSDIETFKTFKHIKAAHEIVQVYADLLSIDNIGFETNLINDVKVDLSTISQKFDSIVYPKIIKRICDNNKDHIILLIHNNNQEITFSMRASAELVKKGFNCLFINDLITKSVLVKSVLVDGGGGGLFGHSNYHLNIGNVKKNYKEIAQSLLFEYINLYQTDYQITLKNL